MPVIKKRITAEYLEQQRNEQNGKSAEGEVDTENSPPPPQNPAGDASSLKRKALAGPQGMLKGLDGEVLVDKRKRILPPAESKLDTWVENNLEKKAESTLSLFKLYQFYTDMCQQDASPVVEMDVFKVMLHNKFGKEFGLQEASVYNGLIKEIKPRSKPVVAASLGYKMKDLIEEALKTSGNPSKGVRFAWVKKYLAAKYPALQVEVRPHFLRKALEREIQAERVELVKGIGFCGLYRQPGPPDVEEEPKAKKKVLKKKGDESAESADDSKPQTEGEEGEVKPEEKTEKESDEKTEVTKEDDKEAEGDEEKDKKKTKKTKKKKGSARPRKPRIRATHSNPQKLTDIFPLAVTYMAEPKETSFGKIRKYLEKHYGKTDVDLKLRTCLEKGCETGMWDRLSGHGAAGNFQLLVDSFDPNHTDSMTDMVCAAIIARTEPKTSSVHLLKSYINEYHPEFNIESKPHKLKAALERAQKQNQIRRVTGIGMTGSFMLVEPFYPSPAILAGDEDVEEFEYDEVEPTKVSLKDQEVYVIRKTKSGRQAPLEITQFGLSSPSPSRKRPAPGSRGSSSSKKKKAGQKAVKRSQYAEVSDEEESSSEEEVDSDDSGYRPRPSQSRGGSGPAKRSPSKAKAKAKPKAAAKTPKGKKKTASKAKKSKPSPKSKKPAAKSPRKPKVEAESEEEEEEEVKAKYVPRATKSGRGSSNSNAKSTPAKKRGRAEPEPEPENESGEDYYEVEDEKPAPAKKAKSGKPAPKKPAAPSRGRAPKSSMKEADSEVESEEEGNVSRKSTPKKGGKKGDSAAATPSRGRAPRSPVKSMKEVDSEVESEEEQEDYVAQPSSSRKSTPKKGSRKSQAAAATPSGGRAPRSAAKSAMKSMREADSDVGSEEEEYVARPSSSRNR